MSITYEDIKKANESIITTTISKQNKKTGEITSKEYAEVNQRIKAFRMVHPMGSIMTEMLSNDNGVCVFKATVMTAPLENGRSTILGTGYAQEKESSSFINSTSYIENCETSAVGRALGMAGFGIDTSVASAEEVKNAMNNQEKQAEPAKKAQKGPEKATEKQLAILKRQYTGENLKKLLDKNNIEKLEDMPKKKAAELINKLIEMEKKMEGKTE